MVIYVAGHGGRARWKSGGASKGPRIEGSANAYNTTFYFWNSEQVTASEFTSWLDRFPPGCRSRTCDGAVLRGRLCPHDLRTRRRQRWSFPIMRGADSLRILHDRSAAGCTPDADEADFEEYSGCFWCWRGNCAMAEPLSVADYDRDGKVSFAEAHSYAIIESDTIDVPVRTSDALLRQYSKLGDAGKKCRSPPMQAKQMMQMPRDAELLELKGPL